MKANYHTHTPRCNHASGQPRKYAEAALANGLEVLGFSDHVPYPFPQGYVSSFRMAVSETPAYVRDLLRLKEKYRGRLEILIGYEAEYYPAHFEAMLNNIRRYPCDYLILGQHYLGNEYDAGPSGGRLTREELRQYAKQCEEGLRTGVFSCFAHPDLPAFSEDDRFYAQTMEPVCRTAKELGIPLELNLLGLQTRRIYPNPVFWALAADVGNSVVLGCDAHQPQMTGDPVLVQAGTAFLQRFGLQPMERLPLRRVQ